MNSTSFCYMSQEECLSSHCVYSLASYITGLCTREDSYTMYSKFVKIRLYLVKLHMPGSLKLLLCVSHMQA